MSKIITKNRNPRLNEFGANDLALNTVTGDLFIKANNRLFKIIGRNQFNQSTTDGLLKLLETSTDTSGTGSFDGFNTIDGFYGISVTNALTGSNVSLHGGVPFDYGQPLPNSPYIKTNGGFDILMDNAGVLNNSSFRVFKDTGIAGVGGSELLKLDNNGNLTVSGSIIVSGFISGSSTIIDEHPRLNLLPNNVNGDPQVVFKNSLGEIRGHIRVGITNNTSSFMSIGADTTDPDLNPTTSMEKHLVLSSSGNVGIGLKTPAEKLTVSGAISASGNIIGNTLTGTINGGFF